VRTVQQRLNHACNALAFAERYQQALPRFGEALADARRLGSLPHVLGLSCYRALHHLRTGNLADAEADARVALETGPRLPGLHAAVALAALLETLAERAEFQAAEAADQRYRLAEQFPTTMQAGWLIAGRGRLRLAERRPAAALGDLLAAGDLFARLRISAPSVAPWRSDAALAHRCGAIALTERTRTELIAAGGRPRRLVLSGLDSLTPGERRIAQLAADGLSNRDIAQNLFITTRTVEGHLTHAYQKLAITSREQLPAALTPPGGETTAPAFR